MIGVITEYFIEYRNGPDRFWLEIDDASWLDIGEAKYNLHKLKQTDGSKEYRLIRKTEEEIQRV